MSSALLRNLIGQLTRAGIDIGAQFARVADDEGIKLTYVLRDLSPQDIDILPLGRTVAGSSVLLKPAQVGQVSGLRITAPDDLPIWIESITCISALAGIGNDSFNLAYWLSASTAGEANVAALGATLFEGPARRATLVSMTIPRAANHVLQPPNVPAGGFWLTSGGNLYVCRAVDNNSATVAIRWREPRLAE